MAIGKTNAGAGGSGGVNFRVVNGLTQPTSPKENTIWINTDVDITSWAFSATEPESPVAGMVWISTGTSSDAQFNALKKMELEVYPTGAKQYIGSEWVRKEAETYLGGQWTAFWDGYLYKNGDECVAVTGGWFASNRAGYASDVKNAKKPTVEKSANSVKLAMSSTGNGSYEVVNRIDLTGVSQLKMLASASIPSQDDQIALSVLEGDSDLWRTGSLAYVFMDHIADIKEYTLDVSNISGPKQIVIGLGVWSASASCTIWEIKCV